MKNATSRILKYGVALLALGYLLGSGKLRSNDLKLRDGGAFLLSLAVLVSFVGSLVSYVRYWFICRAANVDLGLWAALRVSMIGSFFNTFLLGGLGGDAVRIVYLARAFKRRSIAVASVMVDRVIGLVALLLLGGGVLLWQMETFLADPRMHQVFLGTCATLAGAVWCALTVFIALSHGRKMALAAWTAIGLLLALSVQAFAAGHARLEGSMHHSIALLGAGDALLALVMLLIAPELERGGRLEVRVRRAGTIGGALMNLVDAVLIYRNAFFPLVLSTVLTIPCHVLAITALWMVGQSLALPHPPDLQATLVAGPPALISNALPIPGGGIGVGESAFDHLLQFTSPGRAPSSGGAAMFLVYRLITIVVGVLGLPFYVLDRDVGRLTDSGTEAPEKAV